MDAVKERHTQHVGHLCAAWHHKIVPTPWCRLHEGLQSGVAQAVVSKDGPRGAGEVQPHRTIDQHGGTEYFYATHGA